MYYLYTETTVGTWYCLTKDNLRTTWKLALPLTLSRPLTQITSSVTFSDATLIYSGPTIPTIDTHPELFL